MQSGFKIEHQCPQCGAPAVLEETDRLFRCGFCRVTSYLVANEVFRYVLASKVADRELIYVPYWRFKGTAHSCSAAGVESRIVDTSIQGLRARTLPPSLGLRAQAMKLRFATSEVAGRFVQPQLTAQAAAEEIMTRIGTGAGPQVYHRGFIGETLSLIYMPCYLTDRLIDAVVDRPLSEDLPEDLAATLATGEQAHWDAQFIPALCPHCGWDLEGERDSLVLLCRNCQATWKSGDEGLERRDFATYPIYPGANVGLPFWRLEVAATGIACASFADLIRLANLPKVPTPAAEQQQLHFWTPAFKIRPELFLRLARTLTIAQPEEEPEDRLLELPTHPVTLPISEAVESLKVLLATILRPPGHHFPKLPGITIRACNAQLIYLPLKETRHELTHPHYGITIHKQALAYALNL